MTYDPERTAVQIALDVERNRYDATVEAMQTDLQRLRDDWAQGYADQRQAHEDRMASMAADNLAWMKREIYGITEPEGSTNVEQARDASGVGHNPAKLPAGSAGPAQPIPEAAPDFSSMSMADYRAIRREWVRDPYDMSRIGGSR